MKQSAYWLSNTCSTYT